MIQALHSSNQNFDVLITLDHDYLEELHWWVSNINSEWQPNKTSSSNIVYNRRIQGRMGRSLRKSTHKWALVRQRTHPAHKCIGAQGCLFGPKVLSKEPILQGGMPENGQHNGGSPCEQRRWYPFTLPLSTHIGTLCLERNIMISAQRVPGKLNTIADSEKRVFYDSSKWKIDPPMISPFLKGCKIHLFVSRLSAQLPQYVSWRLNPEAVHSDALTMDWAPFKGYAFPPFNLIPAVLIKVSQSGHHISGTHLASTTLVATATEPPDRKSSPPAELQTPPEGPSRPSENSSNVPQTTLSRVSCLWGQYQAMGIPDNPSTSTVVQLTALLM